MTVKADSKGRLTGAQPETRYTRKEHPDGRIEYVPEVPSDFDTVKDVTEEEFEKFFGVSPFAVKISPGFQTREVWRSSEGYLPHGISFHTFVLDENGRRVPGESGVLTRTTLIRIVKSEK